MAGIFDGIKWGFQGLGSLLSPYTNTSTSQALQNSLSDFYNSVYADSQALWDREDSAYQRMVADMKKAGLNPWTGVSSGGLSAGSNIPAMDSLTSLLSVLSTSFDSQLVGLKSYKYRTDFGLGLGKLVNQTLGSLSNLVSTFS